MALVLSEDLRKTVLDRLFGAEEEFEYTSATVPGEASTATDAGPERGPGVQNPMTTHDYVIVGAGSAGCVLAARLSEEGASVLLLEAGGKDRHPNIKIPAAFAKQFHTKLDWDFETEPEPGCDGRRLYVPRGKSLGGSSSMNAMLYVRGRPLDYDGWREAGCPRLGMGRRRALLPQLRGPLHRRRRGPWRRRPAAGRRTRARRHR